MTIIVRKPGNAIIGCRVFLSFPVSAAPVPKPERSPDGLLKIKGTRWTMKESAGEFDFIFDHNGAVVHKSEVFERLGTRKLSCRTPTTQFKDFTYKFTVTVDVQNA